jgi:hypothetical protein
MGAIPPNFNEILQESVQFNNPVSEAALSAIGGAINGLLSVILPVGTVVASMLTQTQFNAQVGSGNWKLADGSSSAGTTYQAVTGFSTLPDLRSVFLRGKDNGRGLNPNGDLALGTFTSDVFASHNHGVNDPGHFHNYDAFRTSGAGATGQAFPSSGNNMTTTTNTTGISIAAAGGNETAPKTVTINYFIRVD